jgi:transcriptional regulator with XRE-family HTH domain
MRRARPGRQRSAYRGIAAPWLGNTLAGHHGRMQRTELADFLRRRRQAVRPAEAGLAEGPRRRTAGLRREEVAMLAGMSVDYVVRLEQGRSSQPSTQLIGALARALRLSDDERDHLFHLAGHQPPPGNAAPARAGMLRMLDLLGATPATVISDLGETLAQNRASRLLMGEQTGFRGDLRFHAYRWFTDPAVRALQPPEDLDDHGRRIVADLRAVAGRRPDEAVTGLLSRLRAQSPQFRQLWEQHEVAVRRSDRKAMLHPRVGRLDLDCETLLAPDLSQQLHVLTPADAETAEKLALLGVLGLQEFASS